MQAFQLYPNSRGSIHIRSKSPEDLPIIKANYLKHKDDQIAVVKALKLLRGLAQKTALSDLIVREVRPGKEITTDNDLLGMQKQQGIPAGMPLVLVRWGQTEWQSWTQNLRVHNVPNLRVADASVLPILVSSNTNAPSIMVAERCSDFLKSEYR